MNVACPNCSFDRILWLDVNFLVQMIRPNQGGALNRELLVVHNVVQQGSNAECRVCQGSPSVALSIDVVVVCLNTELEVLSQFLVGWAQAAVSSWLGQAVTQKEIGNQLGAAFFHLRWQRFADFEIRMELDPCMGCFVGQNTGR